MAKEVATQAALLALIAKEGHAKAWISADAPFVLSKTQFGGAWTFGVNWSGTSKAFGVAQPIDIDGQKLPQGLMASIGFQIAW